jgi:hypothetical protein
MNRSAGGKAQQVGLKLKPGDLSVLPQHSPFAGKGDHHESFFIFIFDSAVFVV